MGATKPEDTVVRQENGSYKICEALAVENGLDPSAEYRNKKTALAAIGPLSKPGVGSAKDKVHAKSERHSFFSTLLSFLIPISVSAYVTWLYFWDLRKLPLGLIDDHEFLSLLGPDYQISWAEVPSLLAATEVGTWGDGNRFRPGYYLLRILQAKLFSIENGAWHEFRLLVFFLTLTVIGYAVWKVMTGLLQSISITISRKLLISGIASGFSVLLASSFRSWGEIIPRLGPSELLVGLGAALMALAVVNLYVSGDRLRTWALGLVGVVLAVTSKENAVVLLVPYLALVALRADFSKGLAAKLVFALSSIFVSGWVFLGVSLGISDLGADVYGTARSAQDFWTAATKNPYLGLVFVAGLGTFLLERSLRSKSSIPENKLSWFKSLGTTFIATTVVFLMFLVLLAENFIYQSDIFPGVFEPARYGLVSELGFLVAVVSLIAICIRTLTQTRPSNGNLLVPLSGFLIVSVLVYSALQFGFAASAYPEQSRTAKENAGNIHEVLKATADELSKNQPSQLVMLPGAPLDYELIAALPIFIELYATTKVSFFVSPAYGPGATKDPFWLNVMKEIDSISENGLVDKLWRISPLRELDRDSAVVCFWFVEEVSSDQCTSTFGIK